jgi:hypothetical protein
MSYLIDIMLSLGTTISEHDMECVAVLSSSLRASLRASLWKKQEMGYSQ